MRGRPGYRARARREAEESDERETRLATEAELEPEGRQRRVMRGRPG